MKSSRSAFSGVSFVCGLLSAFILSSVLFFLFPLRLGFGRVLLRNGIDLKGVRMGKYSIALETVHRQVAEKHVRTQFARRDWYRDST